MSDALILTENVTLFNPDGSKGVTVTTDGVKERLDCNMDGSEIIVSDSTTGTGTLDFVAITGSNANFEITVEVDGTERIRIAMGELAAIGLSNATNVPFWAETANKNFRYSPNIPVGYTTGFKILAKSTGTPLASVKHMTLYRERVT